MSNKSERQPVSPTLSPHAAKNRAYWDSTSDRYLRSSRARPVDDLTWGLWSIPETELQVLGGVNGKDVLDLGCGTGRWAIGLARAGARPVGLDVAPRQLWHARRLMRQAGVDFPLIEASAEDVPLPDESFDLVISDHGAMSFVDPQRVVPEMARLLRPGGLFVFNTESALVWICWDEARDGLGEALHRSYFGMGRSEDPYCTEFQLPHGEWIRLFRTCNLTVEDLIEPRPSEAATPIYRHVGLEWARRWPAETIWKTRKSP